MIFPERNTAFVIITTAVPCPALIKNRDFGPLYIVGTRSACRGAGMGTRSWPFMTLGPVSVHEVILKPDWFISVS